LYCLNRIILPLLVNYLYQDPLVINVSNMPVDLSLVVVIRLAVLSPESGAVASYQFTSGEIKMSGNLYRSSEHFFFIAFGLSRLKFEIVL